MKFYTFETTIVNLKNTLFWTLPTTVQYTVTFNLMGGMFTAGTATTVQVNHGKTVTKPTDPTKVGSTFASWQKADGTAFAFDTETITADITLTASWTLEYGIIADDLTDATSPLRWWMQRATDNAHNKPTNRLFTGGPSSLDDRAVIQIDGSVFTVGVNDVGTMTSSIQTGIPSTGGSGLFLTELPLNSTDLFGSGKTADGYAVIEDTLLITQSGANAQTPITLATIVINSVDKGLFVTAGTATGLLLTSDYDYNPITSAIEAWYLSAQLANEQAYTYVSSVSVTGETTSPSTIGRGTTLTFFLDLTRDDTINSIQFTQSSTEADKISNVNTGVIVGTGSLNQWPDITNADTSNREVFIPADPIRSFLVNNSLVPRYFDSGGFDSKYLMYIRSITPGGNIEVTFLPARNTANPAEEIRVTYARPNN